MITAMMIIAGLIATAEFHKSVMVLDNDQEQVVTFWGLRVNDVLLKAGILLYEGDEISPALEDHIPEGGRVIIKRASRVIIEVDGESHTLVTTERQPAEILALAGITLAPDDLLLADGEVVDPEKPLSFAQTHSLQVHRPTEITLEEAGQIRTFFSTAGTLGTALWESGIILNNADQLIPPFDTPLRGQEISAKLERSREIVIQTQASVVRTRVLASTVGEALSEAGMSLQGLNYSLPAEDQPIPLNGKIRVVQVSEEIILEQEPLPFGVEYTPLSDIALDEQRIVQVGEYGLKVHRLRVVYEDSQEISRSIEDEWIAREPKPRIVGYGTQINLQTVDTPEGPIQYYRVIQAYATSYSPCRIGIPGKCSSTTASGKTLQKGVIGVIRSWYNVMKGQTVYISGYGFATIEDIGAGVSGSHWVDLGYSDEDWISWSRTVTVYFLTPVPSTILWLLE